MNNFILPAGPSAPRSGYNGPRRPLTRRKRPAPAPESLRPVASVLINRCTAGVQYDPEGQLIEFPVYYYLIGKESVLAVIYEREDVLIGLDLNSDELWITSKAFIADRLASRSMDITRDPVFAQAMAAVYDYRPEKYEEWEQRTVLAKGVIYTDVIGWGSDETEGPPAPG